MYVFKCLFGCCFVSFVVHVCFCFVITRRILGLKQTPEFMSLEFHQLAALLYRDNVWVKHAPRDRLRKELAEKAVVDIEKQITDTSLPQQHMIYVYVEHLLGVSWKDAQLGSVFWFLDDFNLLQG